MKKLANQLLQLKRQYPQLRNDINEVVSYLERDASSTRNADDRAQRFLREQAANVQEHASAISASRAKLLYALTDMERVVDSPAEKAEIEQLITEIKMQTRQRDPFSLARELAKRHLR